jgi:hypothetical protein
MVSINICCCQSVVIKYLSAVWLLESVSASVFLFGMLSGIAPKILAVDYSTVTLRRLFIDIALTPNPPLPTPSPTLGWPIRHFNQTLNHLEELKIW